MTPPLTDATVPLELDLTDCRTYKESKIKFEQHSFGNQAPKFVTLSAEMLEWMREHLRRHPQQDIRSTSGHYCFSGAFVVNTPLDVRLAYIDGVVSEVPDPRTQEK